MWQNLEALFEWGETLRKNEKVYAALLHQNHLLAAISLGLFLFYLLPQLGVCYLKLHSE